jgi:hypothetical protein
LLLCDLTGLLETLVARMKFSTGTEGKIEIVQILFQAPPAVIGANSLPISIQKPITVGRALDNLS